MTSLHDLLLSYVNQPILWAFSIGVFFLVLWLIGVATVFLREEHATKIYVVWYCFSLSFVAFSVLGINARIKDVAIEDIFGQFASVYEWLTGFGAEVVTVAVFLALVVLPQWLAYVFSGLSGCATRPMFISQATDVAMWSLIKTVAAISGITLAGFVWAKGWDPSQLIQALAFLFLSFLLLSIRHFTSKEKVRDHLEFPLPFKITINLFDIVSWLLEAAHKYIFGRYSRSTTPTALEQARSGASEALTTGIVQVLQDRRVKSEISNQARSAFEALKADILQALGDAAPTIIEQARSSASEALKTVMAQAIQDAATILDQPGSAAFEAFKTVIVQALQDAGVTSAPTKVVNDPSPGNVQTFAE